MKLVTYCPLAPLLAVVFSLCIGCSQPSHDPPSANGTDDTSQQVAAAESTKASDVSDAEQVAIAAIFALLEDDTDRDKVLTRNAEGHVVKVHLANLTAAGDETLVQVKAFTELEELYLARPEIGDAGLEQLVGLERLWRLDLEGTSVSDVGISTLRQMKTLRDISVKRCSITDQSFRYFAQMEKLIRIRAAQTSVTDMGLECLKEKTNLELLDLHACRQLSDVGIRHIQQLVNLKELRVWGSQITNASAEYLGSMPQLRVLSLQDCSVDDEGLEHLGKLTKLEELTLFRTFVSDEGMQHVANLAQLRRLNLRATIVGSPGLAHLKALRNLEQLDLSETIVGNEGLEHIKKLPKLVDLNLWATRVGDGGMPHLAELTTLTRLNLEDVGYSTSDIALTSEGLKLLLSLKHLEWLGVGRTDVGDDGVLALLALPSLTTLDVNGCRRVTREGITKLEAASPKLHIQR